VKEDETLSNILPLSRLLNAGSLICISWREGNSYPNNGYRTLYVDSSTHRLLTSDASRAVLKLLGM